MQGVGLGKLLGCSSGLSISKKKEDIYKCDTSFTPCL
jgi:hypothetical protein